jgi:DNA polymerase III subunit delta
MAIAVYWGEDDFALTQAVEALQTTVLDPDWSSFNSDKIGPEAPDSLIQGLNQAMTPPFGLGQRLVWLVDTPLLQRCPEDWLKELERTLPHLPETTVLLLTAKTKPDGRLKSTKLLQKYAEIREFSLIPPWKTDDLAQQVRQAADRLGVKLGQRSVDYLVEAIGNNTRQLYSELEKLRLYIATTPLDEPALMQLISASSQNAIQLGGAIRVGDSPRALDLVGDLLRQNEPALRIVNSLVTQFRTWTWVKVMMESGERDPQAIAQAAEISNPKRLYFLRDEVKHLSSRQLLHTLEVLLQLESGLKRGAEELAILQTKVIELCQICQAR